MKVGFANLGFNYPKVANIAQSMIKKERERLIWPLSSSKQKKGTANIYWFNAEQSRIKDTEIHQLETAEEQ